MATLFTLPMAPAPAGTLGAAIGEVVEQQQTRFPQDRIVREAKALAEIDLREILGLRRFDV